MAVAFDAGTQGHIGTPPEAAPTNSSLTYSHTCTGSERAIAVGVSIGIRSGNVSAITMTCTYAGVSMTEIRSGTTTGTVLKATSNSAGLCLFYLLAPASGANNIVVTTSANVMYIIGVSVSATGVATIGNGANTTTDGATNSPTLGVTSATGNLLVGVAGHGDTITGAGGTTTQRAIDNLTNETAASMMIAGTSPGATPNINFTSAANDTWIMLALNFASPYEATPGLWNSGVRKG